MSRQTSLGLEKTRPEAKPIRNEVCPNLAAYFQPKSAVAVDVETYDPGLKKFGPGTIVRPAGDEMPRLVGVSLATTKPDLPPIYLPLFHNGGGNFENPEAILQELRDCAAAAEEVSVVGHNLLYDLEWLAHYGINFDKTPLWCTKAAHGVLDDTLFSYSLSNLAKKLNLPPKLEMPGGPLGISEVSGREAFAYAARDSEIALALFQHQVAQEDAYWALEIERRMLRPLLAMRRRGVRVDEELLEKMTKEREADASAKLAQLGISSFNADADALTVMKRAGIAEQRTEKGNLKRDHAVFESSEHPDAKTYLEGKRSATEVGLLGTLTDHMVSGRIHPLYLNHRGSGEEGEGGTGGTRFGRLSCKSPNIQQQPRGAVWRRLFLPEEGEHWVSMDYSQQEPRLALALAVKWDIKGAKEVAERYHKDNAIDYHTMTAEITGQERIMAKRVFLGMCYGMGRAKLAATLGLSLAKADEVLKQIKRTAPYIGDLSAQATARADSERLLTTAQGRRFNFGNTVGTTFSHKALNRLVQGNASEQTKMALCVLQDNKHTLICQVHDEVCISVPDLDGKPHPDVLADAKKIMEAPRVDLHHFVPSKVDVETGRTWGDSCDK